LSVVFKNLDNITKAPETRNLPHPACPGIRLSPKIPLFQAFFRPLAHKGFVLKITRE